MQEVPLSPGSREAAEELVELHRQEKLFDETRAIHRTCEVYTLGNRLADALAEDMVRHVGEDAPPGIHASWEIAHNAMIIIRRPVGPGRCAVGGYDTSAGVCYYFGIVEC